MRMLLLVLFSFMTINGVPPSHGAQISLQFTRTTKSDRWKIPSFVKGGRIAQHQPTTTVSSVLLQVRGGSDNRGDGDPSGYYHDDDNYSSQRSPPDRSPSKRPDYEEKRVDDYYYEGQDGSKYYEEDIRRYDEYDDRGRRSRGDNSPALSIITKGDRKIGLGLCAMGTFFTISGVFLFFHKTLLRLGNLLFIAGVPMTIGPGRTAGYFLQPAKARATAFLAFGIFLVFVGWPIFGMALEIFGLLNLFGNMIPVAMVFLRQMPIVGGLFKMGGSSRNNKRDRREDDRYYDDDRFRDNRYNDDRYYGDDDRGGGGGDDRYY